MKPITYRLAVLALAGVMAGGPAYLSAGERRGSKVIVVTMDGAVLAGELFAVRKDSVILVTDDGANSALRPADISTVRVVRRSKAGVGAVIGLITGVVASSAILKSSDWSVDGSDYFRSGFFIGLGLAIPGSLIGAAAGTDRVIDLAGETPEGVQKQLAMLAKKARIREAS